MAGYAAFALDMFGTGRALWDRSESLAARRVITEDRSLMQSRASAALRTLAGLPGVDPGSRILHFSKGAFSVRKFY